MTENNQMQFTSERQTFLLAQAQAYGFDQIADLVLSVFTMDQLKTALEKDWYLNGSTCGKAFDIIQFDHMARLMSSDRMKNVRMVNSVASRVSLLKAVARELVRREIFAD